MEASGDANDADTQHGRSNGSAAVATAIRPRTHPDLIATAIVASAASLPQVSSTLKAVTAYSSCKTHAQTQSPTASCNPVSECALLSVLAYTSVFMESSA